MRIGDQFNPRYEVCGFFPDEIVARRRDLTDGQKLLYSRMVRWARLDDGSRSNERAGEVWRSHDTIAAELGKSEKQIRRDLAKLESVGLLAHRQRDSRRSNTYFFLYHDSFDGKSTAARIDTAPGFDRTSTTGQIATVDSPLGDLSGHARPVKVDLSGHARPTNPTVVIPKTHTPGRATTPKQAERSAGGFEACGWNSQEDFEGWWLDLVRKHPNKNHITLAKRQAVELIKAGALKRGDFESGYHALSAAHAERWDEQRGRYATNLCNLLEDRFWKHWPPLESIAMAAGCDVYPAGDSYLERVTR